ncbi:MAG TPA: 3'(2'),5'-bisphosphate nucleotidase CysQ [Hyphomicrobiaceae bacterium]|jgi:3'(2'), 5'-bisphosphate nucleotidase|nr:3'(2'),5'-bisphosphate nucleotidase CysQ [Hyphomicrobiaceae bacterium]
MPAIDLKLLADGLLSVALRAARVQVAHFIAGVKATTKADNSPVTVADHESEAIILEGLERIAPGVPVVSEEAAAAGHIPAVGHTYFLVDPLDGTRSFIRRQPEFTINIALIEDKSPVFGLVYAPAMPDLFVTTGPGEAWATRLLPASEPASLAACRPDRLYTRTPDPGALAALVSASHGDATTSRFLDQQRVRDRRAIASSLKFGLLARGEADLYPRAGPTKEWDTAAGHAVLAAAGGAVTTFEGAPLLYGKPGFVNPGFIAWARMPLPRRP